MILVSFCRILNGRSHEISLFRRCSSPLTFLHVKFTWWVLISVINSIQSDKSSSLQSKDSLGDLCTPEAISEKTQTAHAQLKNHP